MRLPVHWSFLVHLKMQDIKSPIGKIPLLGFMVEKADNDNVKKPFPFKLAHPGPCRTWYFSASSGLTFVFVLLLLRLCCHVTAVTRRSEKQRDLWMISINESVKRILSSGVSADKMP